jgi:hypothetical protein
VYGIVDLIGNLGGVYGGLKAIFTILIEPFSYFSYIIIAIQNLYLVKTNNKNHMLPFDSNKNRSRA